MFVQLGIHRESPDMSEVWKYELVDLQSASSEAASSPSHKQPSPSAEKKETKKKRQLEMKTQIK